jgi:hypothetical protein
MIGSRPSTVCVLSFLGLALLRPGAVGCSGDDAPGGTVSLNGDGESRTSEAGGQAGLTVRLGLQPSEPVTVHLRSTDPSEGALSTGVLTFTAENWNAPQAVQVTGVDDDEADGDRAYAVTATVTSADPAYAQVTAQSYPLTNTDDDTAGITVGPLSGPTSEAGGQATFQVVLNSQPSADVTLHLASDNAAEGTAAPGKLTFTPVNWKAPQTVTVTGVDDDRPDGDQAYSILFSGTESADAAYAALTPSAVAATNTDDDSPGITVSAVSGAITEGGGEATFTVVLNSQPSAPVTVGLASSDPTEGTVQPGELTFTAANWRAPQTVTVTGLDDHLADGDQPFTVVFAPTVSDDADYASLTPASLHLTNQDDDSVGITVGAVSGSTTEAGGQATLTVVLDTEPSADVTVGFVSSDPTEGTVASRALTFTPQTWHTPQTVTLTGVDDELADGGQPYSRVFAPTVSDDPSYAAITPANVTLLNTDDDSAGITVSAVSGPTSEAGGAATFTVVLDSRPYADVTLTLATSDAGEGTLTPQQLTFPVESWSTPQTVTVTGVEDDVADGSQRYAIVFQNVASEDATYAALAPPDVPLLNADDDVAGFAVSGASGDTSELGSQAQFTVVLTSEPTADVTISFDSNDLSEGTVSPKRFTFTSADWSAAQVATVTGQPDGIEDGPVSYAVVFSSTVSEDPGYAGKVPPGVALVNQEQALIGSYSVVGGPLWTSDPPTYSCVEACALIFGGSSSDYGCSTTPYRLDHRAFLSGWGDDSACTAPLADTYDLNTHYDCGSVGCSYSAYVQDHCDANVTNYCWSR